MLLDTSCMYIILYIHNYTYILHIILCFCNYSYKFLYNSLWDWWDVPPHLCLPGQMFSQRLSEGSLQASHFPYLWSPIIGSWCRPFQNSENPRTALMLDWGTQDFILLLQVGDLTCTAHLMHCISTARYKSHYCRTKISMILDKLS